MISQHKLWLCCIVLLDNYILKHDKANRLLKFTSHLHFTTMLTLNLQKILVDWIL